MKLMRIGMFLVGLGMPVMVGCAGHPPFPESSLTGRVVEVKVGESLTPKEIIAKQGDEVRWVNTTNAFVDIAFDQALGDIVSCQKGFVSTGWGYLFGSSEPEFLVIARLHSSDHVSLCFSTPGTYAYNVRRATAATGSTTHLAGTVTIE
jgi:plastocyanin